LEEVFEKLNEPGIQRIGKFGAILGMIGVGKVIVMHCCVVGDPHCSESVTQYWVGVVAGSTVIELAGPNEFPLLSTQLKMYGLEPPTPCALNVMLASGQIIVSCVKKDIANAGGSLMLNVVS